jgi:RHS repeat-associated protein
MNVIYANFLQNNIWKNRFLRIFVLLLFLTAGCRLLNFKVYASETLSFIHSDHLGSTSLVTSQNGEVVYQQVYYPYGSTRDSTANLPTERQYTGQVSDQDQTGLYYYNARYYDPTIAKFTQADNSLIDTLNRYAYVNNSPINLTDPSGAAIMCPMCKRQEEQKNEQGYPDQAKNVTNIGEGLQWFSSQFLTSFGFLDFTPASWGLKNYISSNEAVENDYAMAIVGLVGVPQYGSAASRVGRGFKQAETGFRQLGLRTGVSNVDRLLEWAWNNRLIKEFMIFEGEGSIISQKGHIGYGFNEAAHVVSSEKTLVMYMKSFREDPIRGFYPLAADLKVSASFVADLMKNRGFTRGTATEALTAMKEYNATKYSLLEMMKAGFQNTDMYVEIYERFMKYTQYLTEHKIPIP